MREVKCNFCGKPVMLEGEPSAAAETGLFTNYVRFLKHGVPPDWDVNEYGTCRCPECSAQGRGNDGIVDDKLAGTPKLQKLARKMTTM